MTFKIAVWGASGHALVVADILRLSGGWDICAFVDELDFSRDEDPFCGSAVLSGPEPLVALGLMGVRHVALAVGDCRARARLSSLIQERGFELTTAIHPRAVVASGAELGAGSVVAAGAVIGPAARIGVGAIVNTGASVDHECQVGDAAHISPGARLAGRVSVGREAWVGIGASVIERVRIGERAVIGAGAVVVRDIPEGAVAYGVPARVVKQAGQP